MLQDSQLSLTLGDKADAISFSWPEGASFSFCVFCLFPLGFSVIPTSQPLLILYLVLTLVPSLLPRISVDVDACVISPTAGVADK